MNTARGVLVAMLAAACSGPVTMSPLPAPTATGAAQTTAATAAGATPAPTTPASSAAPGAVSIKEFAVPRGSAPHDVAPAADGGIWYTAQATGELGHLDPRTGQTRHIRLGAGSRPHGVILGADGAAWITDSGLNAIVRVDPRTNEVTRYPLSKPRSMFGPGTPDFNLNTAVFDQSGTLWFTGQNGYFGRVDQVGKTESFEAPRGRGPYGITATPQGAVYYASLAGDHIARIVRPIGSPGADEPLAIPIEPPTRDNGARRVWSDSKGIIWVSEWDAGQLGRYDPQSNTWKEWKLPGSRPQAYAVYVDDREIVWLSDFGASALVRFDPATEKFESFPHAPGGNVRQIHGRPGEVFAPLSALDKILVLTTR